MAPDPPCHIATDSKGNIYLGEVNAGRRALRYSYKGMSK
jgi:hypothetical protein